MAFHDGILSNFIDFKTDYVAAMQEGRMAWDVDNGTLKIGMPGGNVNLQVGQEHIIRCRNITGSTITNGSLVYVTGASGNKPTIALADADTEATADTIIGMATEDIANNSNGYVTERGLVHDVDTSAYAEGTILYLSSTAGQYTDTPPTAPAHRVKIGVVVRQHATVGEILVAINIGGDLASLHDISFSSLANNNLLQYNSSLGYWVNSSDLSLDSLALPSFTSGSVLFSGSGGTVSENNSRFYWDDSNYRLGISTNSPSVRTQIGTKISDDNSKSYTADALMVVNQTATGTAVLNDSEPVLYLGRQGTFAQAYGAMATFKLSRYENGGSGNVGSRTRLDLDLTHDNFDDVNVMTLLSGGNIGLGVTSPSSKLHARGEGTSDTRFIFEHYRTSSGTYPGLTMRKARGSSSSPSAVVNGDGLGSLEFYGYDGTSNLLGAYISSSANGSVGTNQLYARLAFYTNNGSTAAFERVSISPAGYLGIGLGTGVNASYPLDVGGFIRNNSAVEFGASTTFQYGSQLALTGTNYRTTAGDLYGVVSYGRVSHQGIGTNYATAHYLDCTTNSSASVNVLIATNLYCVYPREVGSGTITHARTIRAFAPIAGTTSNIATMTDNLVVGSGYEFISPPSNGALIQGNTGLGAYPASKLTVSPAGDYDAADYGKAITTIRSGSGSAVHIAMIRAANYVWGLGFVYNTNTFAIFKSPSTTESSNTSPVFSIADNSYFFMNTTTGSARVNISNASNSEVGLSLLSGASGNYTALTLGRTAAEASIALPSSSGLWAADAAAGDLVIRTDSSSNVVRIHSGSTGSTTLAVYNGAIRINGGCYITEGAANDLFFQDSSASTFLRFVVSGGYSYIQSYAASGLIISGAVGATLGNCNIYTAVFTIDNAGNPEFTAGSGGCTMGSPTGGKKGLGTLNAVAVYDDNTILTDYVFEKYFDGFVIDKRFADYKFTTLPEQLAHVKKHKSFLGMPSRKEFEEKGAPLGVLVNGLWRISEEKFLYIVDNHNRSIANSEQIVSLKNDMADMSKRLSKLEKKAA